MGWRFGKRMERLLLSGRGFFVLSGVFLHYMGRGKNG